MGGVLVSACCRSDRFECMISCGLNVANSQPNGCVNDFLISDVHKKLHIEEFIAELMNKFEYHLHLFETRGKEEFLKKYCAMWMHSNEEVSILRADSNTEQVVIIGLDSDGYLKVKGKQSGLVFSVQDDGNSFDMLNGLIHTKH
uniref:Biotin protein ligase C-terminal domain-containing protein n=1 Tax=Ditylenchus dipsaci TaxID=166011 RepID=A0A915D3W2_9BILA